MADITKEDLLTLLKKLLDMHGDFTASFLKLLGVADDPEHSLDPDAAEFLAQYRVDAAKGGQQPGGMSRGAKIVSGKY